MSFFFTNLTLKGDKPSEERGNRVDQDGEIFRRLRVGKAWHGSSPFLADICQTLYRGRHCHSFTTVVVFGLGVLLPLFDHHGFISERNASMCLSRALKIPCVCQY